MESEECCQSGRLTGLAVSPGVITDCNSPDFNGVDGILGFGLPKAGSDLPTPVLFAMTDEENKDTNGTAPCLPLPTLCTPRRAARLHMPAWAHAADSAWQ